MSEQSVQVVDYLDEFMVVLKEQLLSDAKRWGNTWLHRPKEGQELRTKARYTDYFDMFEHTGEPVNWLAVVGGALICWIRDNYPELCPDTVAEFSKVLHDTEEGVPNLDFPGKIGVAEVKFREGTIEEYVKDQHRPIGTPASIKSPFIGMDGYDDKGKPVKESGRPFEPVGKYPVTRVINMVGFRVEKSVEDMTTKELVESEPAVQHKSDCAVHNEPAMPAGECDCKDVVNPTSPDGEAVKDSPRPNPNPVAHVHGEVLDSWEKGVLAYSPVQSGPDDGRIIRTGVIFTTWMMGQEIILARCDKDGFIGREPGDHWIEGTLDNSGKYVISKMSEFDSRVNYTLRVSYDYEYFLPRG